jgi:nucleotide-binding universal stress UspA family protein
VLDSSSEHFLEQEPGHAAGSFVGVDAPITAATQYMLRTVSTLFAPYAAHLHLLLLTVLPLPYQADRYTVPYPSFPTHEQWTLAEETLQEVCAALQQDGMALAQIETLVRVGTPAHELVAVASKWHVDCLVVGSRGNFLGQRLRRRFLGSTSRRDVRLASCPVLVVTLPQSRQPGDLVAWYEAAMQQALHDQPNSLANGTA